MKARYNPTQPPRKYDPNPQYDKHSLIAGPTGSGKSYFLGHLIEGIYGTGKPLLILDTKSRNHIGLAHLRGMKVLRIEKGKSYNWEKALLTRDLLCIPDPNLRTPDLIEEYRNALNVVYDLKRPRTLIIEEAHLFNKGPTVADETLELITREGRGYGMFCYFADQRIQNFPKILWSQCAKTFILKFSIPHDIRYIEDMIPGFADLNRDLRPHEVIEYDHGTNKITRIAPRAVTRITPHYG